MEQDTIEINPWAMPAARVMLDRMGYELIDTVMVKVTDTTHP